MLDLLGMMVSITNTPRVGQLTVSKSVTQLYLVIQLKE